VQKKNILHNVNTVTHKKIIERRRNYEYDNQIHQGKESQTGKTSPYQKSQKIQQIRRKIMANNAMAAMEAAKAQGGPGAYCGIMSTKYL
jgi:hypothetical protein